MIAVLTQFLSSFSARRNPVAHTEREGRARGARFAELLSTSDLADRSAAVAEPPSGAKLTIDSGLHRGATIDLSGGEYLIGASSECDIVLRDAGIASRQWRLVCEAGSYSMWEVGTATPGRVPPESAARENGAMRSEYDLGGVRVVLRGCAVDPSHATAETTPAKRTMARHFSRLALAALAFAAIALTATRLPAEPDVPDLARRVVHGGAALAEQGFNAVRFREDPRGGLELAGLVTDAAEHHRLQAWLARSEYNDARLSVQQVAGVVEQVRQALGTDDLQVSFGGTRVRIEGRTRQLALKSRIRMLTDELKGVVEIEDRVAYVEPPLPPGPLPVRISAVMLGSPSYFRTDSGALYFEGAVMPDGAEVVAIEASQIRFRLANKEVVYNLE